MMHRALVYLGAIWCIIGEASSSRYDNVTVEPAARQLYEFRLRHPEPIGILTTGSGKPVDLRDVVTINTDSLDNDYQIDIMARFDRERIPERLVHAKGAGAYGYFEVTHDVSKYIKSDVFNGIGKQTPVFGRFSIGTPHRGGTDFDRATAKGLSLKMYTKEGILDFLNLHTPIFTFRDPINFQDIVHSIRRNPRTNLFDNNMRWDTLIKNPIFMHGFLWLTSDLGLPRGYRKMDCFPVHTYEIYNKQGERHYVRFSFRTEQGTAYFTAAEAAAINAVDPDFYSRDLYNSIENGNYPSWRLEMDILSLKDIQNLDYDPFDLTRLWKNGTYYTVPIGRLVFDKNPDNHFRDVELSSFSPSNLVPGIRGVDEVFKVRRVSYRDTPTHRVSGNVFNVEINSPLYRKVYSRDGPPPVKENMKDAPNYFPNSFSGPVTVIDESRPKEKLKVIHSTAVDLEPAAYLYNHILNLDILKERLAENIVVSLQKVYPELVKKALKLLAQIDRDLASRVVTILEARLAAQN